MIKDIRQAVIIAGGKGTRLAPFTQNLPKPMIPVNGRPFLEYLVELLKENGITEIVMLVAYLSDKIKDHFGDGSKFGLKISYSYTDVEKKILPRVSKKHFLYCMIIF